MYSNTGNVLSIGEEYNISNIKSTLELLSSDYSITYAITVTNLGNTEMEIFSIMRLPDDLEYVTSDYTVGNDKICDMDKCINEVEQTIYLTI